LHTFLFAVVHVPCHIYIKLLFIYSSYCINKLLNTLFYSVVRKASMQVAYTVAISKIISWAQDSPPFLPTSWKALFCIINEKVSEDLGRSQSFQLNIERTSNNCSYPILTWVIQTPANLKILKRSLNFRAFSCTSVLCLPLTMLAFLYFYTCVIASLLEKKKDVLWEKQLRSFELSDAPRIW